MNMLEAARQTLKLCSTRASLMNVEQREEFQHLVEMEEKMQSRTMSPTKLGRWLGWMQRAAVEVAGCKLDDFKEINKNCTDDDEDPYYFDIKTVPKDHTTVKLLVKDPDSPLDEEFVLDFCSWTIGHNGFDHTGENTFFAVGWDWGQDQYVHREFEEKDVIGWLPF